MTQLIRIKSGGAKMALQISIIFFLSFFSTIDGTAQEDNGNDISKQQMEQLQKEKNRMQFEMEDLRMETMRLRTENQDLHNRLKKIEKENEVLINKSNFNNSKKDEEINALKKEIEDLKMQLNAADSLRQNTENELDTSQKADSLQIKH